MLTYRWITVVLATPLVATLFRPLLIGLAAIFTAATVALTSRFGRWPYRLSEAGELIAYEVAR